MDSNMETSTIQEKVNQILSEYHLAEEQYRQEKIKLRESRHHLHHVEQARDIIQIVSQQIEQRAHDRIAGVVTSCIQTIFGKEYSFKIQFNRKRGRTEAQLILIRNGHEIIDPLNEDSGGVMDVASFALRLSCLMLIKPQPRRLLILDEPFKSVSRSYIKKVRRMIINLSEKSHIQIVMATHNRRLVCGKVIRL